MNDEGSPRENLTDLTFDGTLD